MRHHKSGRKLNRTSSHRQAMFKNMAASLFLHEHIKTTLAKAKELRRVAEPLITLGKKPSVANRRLAYARLRDRGIVGKLFDVLGVRYKERPGGYLRILKYGFRSGDTAPMAIVELVDRPATSATETTTGITTPAAPETKTEKKQAKADVADTAPTETKAPETKAKTKSVKKAAKKKKSTAKKSAKASGAKTKKTAKKKTKKK